MPLQRILHPKLGHSQKVALLSDLEYRVWTQYLLTSDDFGVMPMLAVLIQGQHKALATRPVKMIQRCLNRLVEIGLCHVFIVQGDHYLYQRTWQTFQSVDYPRGTQYPKPPDDAIETCDPATRDLFTKHPGGHGRKPKPSPNGSEPVHRTVPERVVDGSLNVCEPAGARSRDNAHATANANACSGLERERERKPAAPAVPSVRASPLVQSPTAYAFWSSVGMHVPWKLHAEIVASLRGEDAAWKFYGEVDDEWREGGPKAHLLVGDDTFTFWRERKREKFGTTASAKADAKSSATLAAAQRFIDRGREAS
jgi:hypothetical protein